MSERKPLRFLLDEQGKPTGITEFQATDTQAIGTVTGLQAALDAKANLSGSTYSGTHEFGGATLNFTGSAGYGQLVRASSSGGLKLFSSVTTAGVPGFIDVDGTVADGVSSMNVRFFRALNTTGAATFQFCRGDGTATVQHQIDAKGLVMLNRNDGSTVIGGTSSNGVDKLQVTGSASFTGAVKLPTFTLATVPAASANARGLIYISNLTGGAAPCFSDGTDWRRFSDRSVAN